MDQEFISLTDVERISLSKRYNALPTCIEPIPESIIQYAGRVNKFMNAITSHEDAEIRQMCVVDFEQLFARSKNLPKCYKTIMLTIKRSETLFDLQNRLVNMPSEEPESLDFNSQKSDPASDSISNVSTKVATDSRSRRSTRTRRFPSSFTKKSVPKRSRGNLPFKRTSSINYRRAEDFKLVKLALLNENDWSTIKKNMNSPRSKKVYVNPRWLRQVSVTVLTTVN